MRHAVAAAASIALLALPAAARMLPPVDAAATWAGPSRAPRSAVAAALPPSVSMHPAFRVPTFLWANDAAAALAAVGRTPSRKVGLDAEASARAHLVDLADAYHLSAGEVAALRMHDLQPLAGGGAVVRFRNAIDGIDVFREDVNVLVDGTGGLVAIGGFAMGAPDGMRKDAQASALTAVDALAAALADYGFVPAVVQRAVTAPGEGGYVTLTLPDDARSGDGSMLAEPARARPIWFRRGTELVPAFYVEVQVRDATTGHVDYYAYAISAVDGALLFRKNQTAAAAFTYRVYAESSPPYLPLPTPGGRSGFPHPSGLPDGFQPTPVPGTVITLANVPFSRNDPWLPAGATRTIGNNVEAYADLFPPNGFDASATECTPATTLTADFHACTTSPATFDYAYDFAQELDASKAQAMAGVVNLFYLHNFLHDWFYDAGFDEAAGNAQTDNFGRGGVANDSMLAEAQDYSDTNNADMSTPADGKRPRMQMYVWTGGGALAHVAAPAAIAGNKTVGIADFGAQAFDITADAAPAQDGANATGPLATDGCTTFTNPAAVAGKIALIDRGTCLFIDKTRNAQAAGAVAVLLVNNVSFGITDITGTDATVTIPTVMIPLADGNAIRAQIGAGQPVVVRMARKPRPARDGSLDASLVAHEWAHYLSGRLVGNGAGLNANQGGGMSEGWSDFVSLLLLVKAQDRSVASNANFDGVYAASPYAIGGPSFAPDLLNNSYYYGIRRYPYSRDMTKNPLTLRHISDGVGLPPLPPAGSTSGSNSEVHATGEVWASMLWECYGNLVNDTGRLTFAQAQDRMKRYLVASLKLTPLEPTFVTGRDALLAVMQAQDPKDRNLCLHGFAKRGAGVGAVAPAAFSDDNRGVVESFETVLPAGGAKTPAIEYYNADFEHYFVTSDAGEIAKLDNGTFVGWARTGESFNVYADAPAGSAPVCRFFSTAFGAKSSHFYTPDANECGVVKRNQNWQFESGSVFAALAPGPAGDCPTGSNPVYRLYNNGQGGAPNHRYTASFGTRGTMLAAGWISEGNGPLGVIMCSPA